MKYFEGLSEFLRSSIEARFAVRVRFSVVFDEERKIEIG